MSEISSKAQKHVTTNGGHGAAGTPVEAKPSLRKRVGERRAQPAAPVEPAAEYNVNRQDLMLSGSTVRENGKKGEVGEKLQVEVGIPKDVSDKYNTLMRDHVRSIMDLPKRAPEVLEDPRFASELNLLKRFVNAEGKVDEAEIAKYLQTAEGLGVATTIFDNDLFILDAASGIVSRADPTGERGMMLGKGDLRRSFLGVKDSLISPKGGKEAVGIGRKVVEDIYNPDKFMTIAGDKVMVQYLKVTTGFDLGDYYVNPKTKKVEKRPGVIGQSSISPQELQAKRLQLMDARRSFLIEACGVDARKVDSNAEEWILHGRRERVDLRIYEAVMDELKAKGGLQDVSGNRQYRDVGGVMELNPLFKANELNFVKSTKAFTEARLLALGKVVGANIEKINNDPGRAVKESKITALKELSSGKENGVSIKEARDAEIKSRVDALSSDGGRVDQLVAPLKEITGAIDSVDKARRDTGGRSFTDMAAAIVTEENKVDGTLPPPGSVSQRRDQALTEYANYIATEKAKIPGTTDAAARLALETGIVTIAGNILDRKTKPLDKEEARIQSKVTEMRTQAAALEAVEKALSDPQKVQPVDAAIDKLEYSWGEIKGVTNPDLQVKPFDELLEQINRSYASTGDGWPKESNNSIENRNMLLQAMIESRALVGISRIDPARSLKFTDLLAADVSEGKLLSGRSDEIRAELVARGMLTPPSEADIVIAQEVARERLGFRKAAAENVKKQIADRMTRLNEEKLEPIDSSVSENAALVLGLAVTRKADLKELGVAIVEQSGEYTNKDKTVLGGSDMTVTEAEKDAGVPYGYIRGMEGIFGYGETANRAAEFKKILAFYPPKRYAEHLNEFLNLGGNSSDPGFVEQVFDKMKTQIDGRKIRDNDMRHAIDSIVERLADEVLASVK